MGIVKPTTGEDKTDFIERCIEDQRMKDEYPDRTMRTDQCIINWDHQKDEQIEKAKSLATKSLKGLTSRDKR